MENFFLPKSGYSYVYRKLTPIGKLIDNQQGRDILERTEEILK